MKLYIYLISSILLLMSCQESAVSVEPELGKEFNIQFGEELLIQEENLKIKFADLVEESRCPKGVTCVWSGNAKLEIIVNGETFYLNTHLNPEKSAFSEYQIQLITVEPYPVYEEEIKKEKYNAKLLITRN